MKNIVLTLLLLASGYISFAQTFALTASDHPDGYELTVNGDEDIRLIIDGFSPGDEFALQLRRKPGQGNFDFGALPAGTIRYQNGFVGGRATDSSLDICLETLTPGDGTLFFTLQKQTPAPPSAKSTTSPFAVTNSRNLDSLLNVVFRNESCFELFPDTLITGDQTTTDGRRVMQTGVFTGGTDAFGMESGIILSTGAVTDAVGPNTLFPKGQVFIPSNNHIDLDAAIFAPQGCEISPERPLCYADVAVLQFEFVPTTDTISFNYIFFSEEYCFNLGGSFSDAFAFFLEGPGVQPNGRANIARLPSGERVSTETLNHVTTPDIFIDNSALSFDDCTGMPNDPIIEQATAYDGFSEKLQVKAAVTPCERHVLKLMVVDVGDATFDSGILLEAGSFTAGLIADPLPSVAGTPGSITPIEGCDTATITFSRLFADADDLAQPLPVRYNIITTGLGLNLADEGVDFELPPSPFIIPPGDSSATLRIPITGDNFPEGAEAFVIRYDGTCNCDQNRDTFWIQDAIELVLDVTPDQDICGGSNLELTASASGGAPSYEFEWPDGQTTPSVLYTGTGRDTLIYVAVTDSCGQTELDSVRLTAPNVAAMVAGDFSLCAQSSAAVPLTVQGTGPWSVELRVDSGGVTTTEVYVITQDTTFDFATDATISLLSVTDASGCGGAVSGTATVTSAGILVQSTVGQPTCDNDDGTITLAVVGGNDQHTFTWGDGGITTPDRSSLAPGNYTVAIARVTEPDCAQNLEFTLEAPAALTVDSIAYTRPACPGESIELAAVISGGTAPYSFIWPDSSATDSVLSITTRSGTSVYPILVTDDCGVETSASVIITLPAFSASLDGRFSLCSSASVDVPYVISGPADDYTVSMEITGADGTIDTLENAHALVASPGQFDITLTAAASIRLLEIRNGRGCAGELVDGNAEVVDPQLNFAGTVETVNCHGEATGSITLDNPGSVPLNFTWANGPMTQDRTNLPAGTYALRIEDAADATCFRDTTFEITQPAALAVTITSQAPSCAGEGDVLAPVITGGTAPYSISWPDSMLTDSLLAINTIGGTSSYPVQITDACGATVTETFLHTFPDVRAQISGNYSVCNAPFNIDVPLTVSGSTFYTVTIEENGSPRTFTITQDTLLNYTEATVIQLTAVFGADGCAGLAGGIANVTDGNFAVETTVTDVLCAGAATGAISFVINGNPGGYTYAWDRPGLSGNNVTNLTSGTYSVTATELTVNGCTWDTTFAIGEPPSAITLVRDSSRDVTCRSGAFASVSYAGGTGSLSYNWSNGTVGPTLDNPTPGLYEVSISDDNGCEVIQFFDLRDERTSIIAGIAASTTELDCNQTSLTLSTAQNTVATTYQWRDGNGGLVGNTRMIDVSSPGEYSVLVEDPMTGCSATDTIEIEQSGDLISLILEPVHPLNCLQSAVDLTVSHPNFTGAVSYVWRLNGNQVGTGTTLPGITTTGTYEVTATRQDNGCPSVATTEVITDNDLPQVTVPNAVITSNCSAPSVTIAVSGDAAFTYAWTTADGNINGPNDVATTTANRPGTYSVLITNPTNGCTTTETVEVVQDGATIQALAGTDQTLVCTGQGTILFGQFGQSLSGTTGRWYDPAGEIISESRNAFTTVSGPHVFEAIHPESGCSTFDTMQVVNDGPTAVEYTLQQAPCPEVGGRLFVTSVTGNNGPFDFSSPTGETEPFGTGLRGLAQGNNVLIVTDQLGCELRDTFQIFDFGEFTGNAPDVEVSLGEEAVLGVETNRGGGALVRWTWDNLPDSLACASCPEPSLRPLESFIATVAVEDSNGCVLTLRQNVIVRDGDLLYMPTGFSPGNGDGVNDVYTVFGDAEFVTEVQSFGVFDRWGNQVFGNQNFPVNEPTQGWNGQINGKNAQPGVYAYTVTVRYWDNRVETIYGSFTLVR